MKTSQINKITESLNSIKDTCKKIGIAIYNIEIDFERTVVDIDSFEEEAESIRDCLDLTHKLIKSVEMTQAMMLGVHEMFRGADEYESLLCKSSEKGE